MDTVHSDIINSLSHRTSIAIVAGTRGVRNWRHNNDIGIFVRSISGEYNRHGKGKIF